MGWFIKDTRGKTPGQACKKERKEGILRFLIRTAYTGLLLPLDGGRWFGSDIINDTIDTVYFVHDTVRDAGQYVIR